VREGDLDRPDGAGRRKVRRERPHGRGLLQRLPDCVTTNIVGIVTAALARAGFGIARLARRATGSFR
jgi:hypothetical protein